MDETPGSNIRPSHAIPRLKKKCICRCLRSFQKANGNAFGIYPVTKSKPFAYYHHIWIPNTVNMTVFIFLGNRNQFLFANTGRCWIHIDSYSRTTLTKKHNFGRRNQTMLGSSLYTQLTYHTDVTTQDLSFSLGVTFSAPVNRCRSLVVMGVWTPAKHLALHFCLFWRSPQDDLVKTEVSWHLTSSFYIWMPLLSSEKLCVKSKLYTASCHIAPLAKE